MSPFIKLANPDQYVACDWDLTLDHDAREYWVTFFIEHSRTILGVGVEAAVARGEAEASAAERARQCHDRFVVRFKGFLADPAGHGRVTILVLDAWRDNLFREFGFDDAFVDLKRRENERMLPFLPPVCAGIDEINDAAEQLRAVIEGVFAGNIFDMGASATAKAFLNASPDFFEVRRQIPQRPWLIDDFDRLTQRWLSDVYHKAVIFIDNAGSDFILGALPLARWLARRGTHVVLAANERPTLNDMTIAELRDWWPEITRTEPTFGELPITSVSSGTGEPLIDLSEVSSELNAASEDADLVILEGMGRGVESNLGASFTCDALNIAMLKDHSVAKRHGGKLFDVVCRFRQPMPDFAPRHTT
jgi:type II pantothenate kinase